MPYFGYMPGYTSPYGWLDPELRDRIAPEGYSTPVADPTAPFVNSPGAQMSYGWYERFRPDQALLDQFGRVGSSARFNERMRLRREHELAQWIAAGGNPEDFIAFEDQQGFDWNQWGSGKERNAARTNYYMQNLWNLLDPTGTLDPYNYVPGAAPPQAVSRDSSGNAIIPKGGGGDFDPVTGTPNTSVSPAASQSMTRSGTLQDALMNLQNRYPGYQKPSGGKQGFGGNRFSDTGLATTPEATGASGKPGWGGNRQISRPEY